MNRLLIVDGSNLLFQMFFGMPARIVNHQGKAIQGTLGFTGALLKIIRMVKPTHAIVLFDGEHENERSALDADYKANRIDYSTVPEEESPFSQIMDVYAALDFMEIVHTETTDCEADDLIASYALTYAQEYEIVISSFDSDLFQLISDRVSILRYRGEKTLICTPLYLTEKYGITPAQYADFKSLTGDASDNIRGADKIGPKTAAALLREYGSLERIIENAENIRKPSIRASVLQNTDRLRTNFELIKLRQTHQIPFNAEELTLHCDGFSTNTVLSGIGLR